MSNTPYKIRCSSCNTVLFRDEYNALFTLEEPEPVLEDYGWHDGMCALCAYKKSGKIYGGLFGDGADCD